MLLNAGEGRKLLEALQWINSGALVGVHGVRLWKMLAFLHLEDK